MMSPPRPALAPLPDARAWVAALGLGPVPAPPPARVGADLVVGAPVPRVPSARRSGWAVPSEATLGASPYGPVPLAGLRRIAAGEALPPGTDAVLLPDQASEAGPWVEVTASAAPWEGVVEAGGHLRAGQLLARAGSVAPLLVQLLSAAVDGVLHARLAALTPPGLRLGPVAVPAIHGLAARPIEETMLGYGEDGRPCLRLPADPAAMLLAWCALVGPAGGRARARLSRKLPSAVGRSELVLARLGDGAAHPLAAADRPCLAAFIEAAGWVEAPPGAEGWPEGAEGTVTSLPALLTG